MPQRAIGITVAIAGLLFVICLLLLRLDVNSAAHRGPKWKRNLILAGIFVLAAIGLFSFTDIPQRIGGVPAHSAKTLDDASEWRRLSDLWKEAEDIAVQYGDYPFDKAEKTRLLKKLRFANRDIDTLAAARLISAAERDLLKKDLELLIQGVNAVHTTEDRGVVMCYEPMPPAPWPQPSARRLSDRMMLLERIAASEKIQPEIVEKVLTTIEKDISILENTRSLDQLSQGERAKAEELRDRARVQVGKIKAKLAEKSTAE